MLDYIVYDLKSDLTTDQVFGLLKPEFLAQAFPTFKWWFGRNDYPEPYISGRSPDLVVIWVYPEQDPGSSPKLPIGTFLVVVSFHGAWRDLPDREHRKREVTERVTTALIPCLGQIAAVDEHP